AGSILSTLSFDAAEKGNPDMRLDIEEGVASPVSLYPGNDVSQKTSERLSERKPEKISGRTSPAGIPREGERAEKASSVVEAEGPVVSAAGGRAEGGGQTANGETSGGGKDSRGQADRGDLSDRDAGRPAVAGADKETEKPVANRRTSAFEQFFDDVMTRRGEARTGALELPSSKGSPLSGQAALREGLDNVVRFIRANGEQKAALIVDPPALGRVSVELTSTATGLDASIKVSSEQIRQLVQDQIVQLRTSLAQQGVELAHFSVDVQQENSRRHQDTEQQKSRTRGITGKEDPDDGQDGQTVFRVDLTQGLLWWVG
ncbi:MAG: flagellar hook-length control protein FliK, partial [Synergistaceae bacterium]|nr:flagellar hook-length control protein FliK [Synergistaceae bacterium]